MRILIGVQGTGNGHLSRCSALAEALESFPDVQVQFLVSGRDKSQLFDMAAFGDWQWRQGLSFVVEQGKVNLFETVRRNQWQQFWKDVRELDLSDIDLVVSDYEPITAWAGRLQGKKVIGLGRQYAFYKPTPSLPISAAHRQMLRWFAPADVAVGMHWFDDASHVLPPIIHQRGRNASVRPRHYVVYLPFEPLASIHKLLQPFENTTFEVFHPQAEQREVGHIRYFAPSRIGFAEAMARAEGIISNAGFETASEALATGKKLLVKPLTGQFEQTANAECLERSRLAQVMWSLDSDAVSKFLQVQKGNYCRWPNVAHAVAEWLSDGAVEPVHHLSARLWQRTEFEDYMECLKSY
ncbi:glycosyltransferase family protein [Pseudidiomarina andamanensis]|uniref:Glycosyltransferase n=1 Tax=Pseudidiomarina andamanensis TaxID=1940690 RepID=A0AA92ETL6_9GAMM|nr:glycosyltransferase family protein [Pseudidiomarina andamanensis]MDS0218103.1 glycosyltransferase [Pseudidiomarina andamanensis]QGT94990.1 glycosyltransferase [Pseudidiomarina andamanensis]